MSTKQDDERRYAQIEGERDYQKRRADRMERQRDALAEALRQSVESMQDSGYPNSSVVVREARAALAAMEGE